MKSTILPREKIVQIVKSRGALSVSWRYRDDGLRTQCKALARRGILKRDWKNYHPGSDRFIAGPNINLPLTEAKTV